ncbi:chloramphenicol phosphotransferase CPT family protein [Sutcliffiella cohnii]|uniref:Chloramphenicol phosphotransferase n=1 Tax=Sutcliffiella cohnii TaxID=33932 RepID=A0A223KLH5_9BACI|nr:AAA family ATPase [Sutcliffiella cohnii]AST90312.1 hypothetical protein BC6307_03025 [Sutcliffiella cohnii]MED4017587.1 AAA family ATPase [Sutcliffiella cohnii]
MEKGKIILLNGVSSSGKSTLSRELVAVLPHYFHFSIDDYDYIIEKMEDRQEGKLIPIPTEYYFHRNIAMFSNSGVNLVVDHILHDQLTLKDWFEVLNGYPVFYVGVHCPVEELARRELARGDRRIGQSKEQLLFVHQNDEVYDVEVNTFIEQRSDCVNKIIQKLNVKAF